MVSLDQVLSVVVPIGIVIFLFSIFYGKFKNSFDGFFRLIAGIFGKAFNSGKEKAGGYSEEFRIVYKE